MWATGQPRVGQPVTDRRLVLVVEMAEEVDLGNARRPPSTGTRLVRQPGLGRKRREGRRQPCRTTGRRRRGHRAAGRLASRSWNQVLISSSSSSSGRPGRRRFRAAVGGGFDTSRSTGSASRGGATARSLNVQSPIGPGLVHPVLADLGDQSAPERTLRLDLVEHAALRIRLIHAEPRPQTRSNAAATEPPPPRQSVASP